MAKKYSKIKWCCIQRNGIKLIKPNEILGKSYLDSADSNLLGLQSNTLKIQNSSAFNACYNSFYSILQKTGIKCEIQECSFELFNLIAGFTNLQINLIKILKKNNSDIEQNLKRAKPVNQESVIEFVKTAKQIFNSLSLNSIRKIRQEILLIAKNTSN